MSTSDTHIHNSRKAVREVIRYGITARVPKGELCINDSVVTRALNCGQAGFDERRAFAESLGLDIFTLSPIYSTSGKLPEPEECLWPDLEKWTRETQFFTFAILDGAFERGMRSLGMMDFSIMLKKLPLAVQHFVDGVESLNIAMIRELAAKGVDGIILADDIAFPKGLFISPKNLREYFFPSLARQVEEAMVNGLSVFYHSDGYYREVLGDIINAGFTGLHCLDHNSGMKADELQREIGDKLCLWGHLDTSDVNQASDPDYLQGIVTSTRALAQDGKKFILGTNSGLFDGMDIDCLKAIYRSV